MVFVPEIDIPARFSPEERERIIGALEFAAQAHKTQRRKGKDGAPYIVHPAAVAGLLMHEFSADADTVIAGLLHDTVEDTDTTLADVEREFGPQVRFLVDGATDYGEGDGNPKVQDKMERAQRSMEKARRYAMQDQRVLLVKIADRWDNLKTVHVHTPRGQVGYSMSTKEFHAKEARRLGFTHQAEAMEALCDAAIAKWGAYGGAI